MLLDLHQLDELLLLDAESSGIISHVQKPACLTGSETRRFALKTLLGYKLLL